MKTARLNRKDRLAYLKLGRSVPQEKRQQILDLFFLGERGLEDIAAKMQLDLLQVMGVFELNRETVPDKKNGYKPHFVLRRESL